MKQYNVKNLSLKFLGVQLVDDIPDGDFVTVEEASPDDWNSVPSGDGVMLLERNNNRSAVINVNLRASSSANAKLTAIRAADRLTSDQIGPMVCVDPSGPLNGSGFVGVNTRILGKSGFTRGTSLGVVTWRFICEIFEEAELGVSQTTPAA